MDAKRFLIVALAWLTATAAHAQQPMPVDASAEPYRIWSGCGVELGGFYGSLDYLLWWMKPVCLKVAALTAGAPGDTVPGALGQPGTMLLVGQSRFEFSGASGVRPKLGLGLTPDGSLAVEVEGFSLETVAARQAYQSSPGSPPTYIPYTAPDATQQALPFTVPGLVNGSVLATGSSHLWGAEANLVGNVLANNYGEHQLRIGLLAGVRYLQLKDQVQILNVQTLASNHAVSAQGYDSLQTINQFYGVQVGQRLDWSGPFGSLGAYGKLAFGETSLANDFGGSPLIGSPVAPGLVPGPVQVLPSNAGYHRTYRVSIVPEIGTTFRMPIGDRITVSLGYSLLYWNRILCPGDLMDPRVNTTQLPFRGPVTGPALPAVQPVQTDYFAQGINAGFEFRF